MLRNVFIANTNIFDSISGFQILAHFGYVVPFFEYKWLNIVFWTLAIEFQFYLVFAILYPLITKYKFLLFFLPLPSLLIMNDYETIFTFFSIFNLGIFLAYFYNNKMLLKDFSVCIIISSLIVIYLNGYVVYMFTLPVLLVILGAVKISSRFLNFLGRISYSLYLLHTLVAFSIINIAHRFPKTIIYQLSFTLLALAVTVIISYWFYQLIEKPSAEWSKKIVYSPLGKKI